MGLLCYEGEIDDGLFTLAHLLLLGEASWCMMIVFPYVLVDCAVLNLAV